LVYVTTTLPALEAVKTPVEGFTEPTAEEGELQIPPEGVAVSVTLPFKQTSLTVEVMVGAALTVKVSEAEHPLLLVKVIVVVPEDNGVTTPDELIVATEVLLELQPLVPKAVPVAVNVTEEPPAVANNVPEIEGFAYTVTAYESSQPFEVV
jgi:hypothetical protein